MAMNGRAVDAIVRQLTPQLQYDVGAEQWRTRHIPVGRVSHVSGGGYVCRSGHGLCHGYGHGHGVGLGLGRSPGR